MARTKRWFTRWKGRVKREVGESTGDRRVEAKGDAEIVTGREPDDETLEAAVRNVRIKHDDIRPGVSERGRDTE